MRLIGTIESDQRAATFSDYLYTQGIENTVERNDANRFEVWVSSEDRLEEATGLLRQFIANPAAPEYAKAPDEARRQRAKEQSEAEVVEERTFDSHEVMNRQRTSPAFVTALLIGIAVIVGLMTKLGYDKDSIQPWVITKYESRDQLIEWTRGLKEIRQGEVWRLVTPIFVHFGPVHLLFNMLWIFNLGIMIERSIGSARLLLFVLGIAILSNLAEYALRLPPLSSGAPNFGGMSGVVYGLFGYAWMKSRYDFASGIEIHPSTAMSMLVWYVLCLTGILPVANMVHTVGLAGGIVCGYVSAARSLRRLP
jgi:GlpG protein